MINKIANAILIISYTNFKNGSSSVYFSIVSKLQTTILNTIIINIDIIIFSIILFINISIKNFNYLI